MRIQPISASIGTLGLRSCNTKLSTRAEEHTTIEIVKWQNAETCYVIAYFLYTHDDDYSLKFVGDRPLQDDINFKDFEILIRMAYNFLLIPYREDEPMELI